MLRRTLLACLAVCACSQPAWAQTRIYVSGDVFAEVGLFPSQVSVPNLGLPDTIPPGGGTWGGGGRIGAFFSPEWSLELGVDRGKAISDVRTVSVYVPVGLVVGVPTPQYQSRSSRQLLATSVLIGYHPAARGRAQAGFRGGLSIMRTNSTLTSASTDITFSTLTILPSSSLVPVPVVVTTPSITVTTSEVASIGYGMFATLGGEVAIDVSRHFAVVPEVRAHVNLSTLLVRPGVSARWRW